jgi:hypothetical protein
MAKHVTSNKAFRNQKKTRAMAGSIKYSWKPNPFQKGDKVDIQKEGFVDCDNLNSIDNLVTYVYEVLPDGNHSSYVECDYVD